MVKIKQIYTPYYEWEDWKNGMWRIVSLEEQQDWLNKAISFTSDWVKYGTAMQKVVYAWPRTMLNALTSPSTNKRAFLGHCACSYEINCPESITRMAWKELTEQQRIEADEIAQLTIDEWTERYAKEIK